MMGRTVALASRPGPRPRRSERAARDLDAEAVRHG